MPQKKQSPVLAMIGRGLLVLLLSLGLASALKAQPVPATQPSGHASETVQPAPARDKEKTLKVATYNLEWFIDAHDDPYSKPPSTINPKPQPEIELIAKVLRRLDADIVTFQELENEGVLREMIGRHLPDMGYKYVVVGQTNSTFGQNLGVMSRKPIVSVTSHRFQELKVPGDDRTWRFSRDLLKVTVQATDQKTMDVYVVHLKSKRSGNNDPQSTMYRLAETLAAQRVIREQLDKDPGAWIVMTGDFNDTADSRPMATLIAGEKPLLIDPHAAMPAESKVTYLRKPYRSTIDYTLLSPALVKRVVPEHTSVLTDDTFENKQLLEGSDHAPVFVTLDLTK